MYRNQNQKTMTTEQYIQEQTEKAFIAMIKIEMLLSGKSFNEAKEIVKQELKKQGLM